MDSKHIVRGGTAAVVFAGVIGAAGVGSAVAGDTAPYHGVVVETDAGAAAGYDLHGSVKMTVGPAGTHVTVTVVGLDPAKSYGSHLHDGTCASGGGGHYQDDPDGGVVPPNELWLSSGTGRLEPNRGGVAHGAGSAPWAARVSAPGPATNAQSVVVHEPGSGARIACADLE